MLTWAAIVQSADLYVSSIQSTSALLCLVNRLSCHLADCLQSSDVPQFSPLPHAAQALRRDDQDPDDVQRLS